MQMAWSPQLDYREDYRTEGGRARGARSFQFWNLAGKGLRLLRSSRSPTRCGHPSKTRRRPHVPRTPSEEIWPRRPTDPREMALTALHRETIAFLLCKVAPHHPKYEACKTESSTLNTGSRDRHNV